VRKVAMVDLYNPDVLAFNRRLFGYFIAAGVDGFRLDHMMDDLDWKGRLTDLFTRFWAPLLASLRLVNPKIIFIAEQANWGSYGFEYFTKGTVDRVFAFRLAGAIQSLDKSQLTAAADSTLALLPPGKEQVVFIENHDVDRFATRVGRDPGKERAGAALNLLLGGIPSIYYGQELGMFGSGGFNKYGVTDANDIPRREAFEWYAADTGRGMALWYKGSGAWWDSTNLKPFDGVSLEEEEKDTTSLWHYYVRLLRLRRQYPVLASGRYVAIATPNPHVFTFFRELRPLSALVMVNLSPEPQRVPLRPGHRVIFGNGNVLPPYGVEVSILQDKFQ
jgi:alpha-amylase